ncbi:hypothetical protein SLE2022_216790 [Rubroshorea leprosula]
MESENGSSRGTGIELQFDGRANDKLGLQKGFSENSMKVGEKAMDGEEEKSGSKKRLKVPEVGLDSDDDEPIGFLLKMRRPKNAKKIKGGLEGGGRKGHRVEKKEEKLVIEDEDLGGMDDTLASFRKKLKGPKKDVGSGTLRGQNSTLNRPVGGDGASVLTSVSKSMDKGQVLCEGGSNMNMDRRVESKHAGKVKRSKNDLQAKSVVVADNSDGPECQVDSLEGQNEEALWPGKDSNRSSDEKLSLSMFSEKNQSDLGKKSGTNSSLKKNLKAQNSEDGLNLCSTGGTKALVNHELEMPNSTLSLGKMIEVSEFCDIELHQQSDLSAMHVPKACFEISSPAKQGTSRPCSADEFQKKSCINASEEATKSECRSALNQCEEVCEQNQNALCLPLTCNNSANSCLEEKSLEAHANAHELVSSIQHFKSSLHQSSENLSKGTSFTSHDFSSIKEADGASPMSIIPDEIEGSVPNSEPKDINLSANQRAGRSGRKHRHRDMAYEGDADWEILSEQGFLGSQLAVDGDSYVQEREKFDENDNGAAAAVSAGLKARTVGPVEKIKFKDVLKRRGGLQEYLECRNHILDLWSKDVSRILPLADCGVSDNPSEEEEESPRASLLRKIYVFLDQSGYINFGIASTKEKAKSSSKHNYRLLEEKIVECSSAASVADSDDGVAFILGQVKGSETSLEVKNVVDDQNQSTGPTIGGGFVDSMTLELPDGKGNEEWSGGSFQQNGSISAEVANMVVNLPVPSVDVEIDLLAASVITPEERNDSQCVQAATYDCCGKDQEIQCDPEFRKKIIVIGAGPAGLTAARHLKRQGFSVTILEARSRIGGRVYTDRSSLSVPVDLGASIITGVEADVSTDRRPDPSSLVCAQLGLELTVLNSACPLYDIVTGQKVPTDLDDALEAEYNNLLDDMVFLVAQKGECAMRMSLEDGLEYALRRHRMERLGTDAQEVELSNFGGRGNGGQFSKEDILSPLERRVMNWHFAHLEYGCAALLKDVSLPHWNQDDVYGGFGGAHCMIKGGYSRVVESLGEGLSIHSNHVVTNISYGTQDSGADHNQHGKVKISTSNGSEFSGDAVLITVPLGCLKAETIKFSPPLPQWKQSSIQRLGFGVLNKVVLEFPEVFWDDNVDYFGATAEETDRRGQCFMFWNVRKTVGAPVLIALVVGKAAIDGQNMSSSDHVHHAVLVLRKLFGDASVPDPVASVVTDWGRDPFSYGAYSYVAIGASGEDYDLLGRPVENCLFFAGEATCKEHPDTVGGAMMSGLREAVRIIDIFSTGNDYTAEVEAMEAAQRRSESERDEVRDITKRLEVVELSNVLYRSSLDRARILAREALLRDMFFNVKTTTGRLHLAKKLLDLPVESLKSFAGTKEGLTTLNSWMLDSLGKDGTQLLRHCVRILVLVSTDLLAVRSSGVGKTVKEKVCVHTSRDIRAIASQLVNVWLEIFRKEKASNGVRSLRQATVDSWKRKSFKDPASGKPPLRSHHGAYEIRPSLQGSVIAGSQLNSNVKQFSKTINLEDKIVMSEEEQAAFAAEEAARAAAKAAAEVLASSEANRNKLLLPKIPSFHKFVRREQYAQMDESKWPGGALGRQDCISEIDSRNCRVRDWSVDFSAACVNLGSSRMSVDNLSQRSPSNEIACHMNIREHSGESSAVDSSIFTKAWVDTAGSVGVKDYHAIERWQSQAAAADPGFYDPTMHIKDEEDSYTSSMHPTYHGRVNESSVSQVTINKEPSKNHPRGAERIKQAVVDYVASLLMPLYKARKIDKDGYKSIMKKSATKVMEKATDAEKAMAVSEFLDFKRKNKIRALVDKLIEKHMVMKSAAKS